MKIVIVSDNHRDHLVLDRIVMRECDATSFLHAGDSEMCASELRPFISVKGNCDFDQSLPEMISIDTPAGKLMICHRFYKRFEFLNGNDCAIFIHGHTHHHYLKYQEGCYIACPGSTTYPRDNSEGTYLVITFIDGQPNFVFKDA